MVQDQFVQEAMLALEALGYSKMRRACTKVEKTLNKNKYDSVDQLLGRSSISCILILNRLIGEVLS